VSDRLKPLRPRQWPPDFAAGLASALRPADARHPLPPRDEASPNGINAMGMQAIHPELSTAFNQSIRHALYFSTLTPRQRELLVLRVAHQRDSAYEWAQHVYQAGVVGITRDEVERVREGPQADGWSPLEGALLAAADDLLAHARISDTAYSALAAEMGPQQLMDVVFTVGAYETFAMALRTFDVELDEDLRPYS
jgi:alkylhydroperoxidase family enzyme